MSFRPALRLADADRPTHVAGPTRVPERHLGPGRAFGRALARTAGARTVFVNVDRLPPGAATSSLHAHLADEELVLVLSGHPTLRQCAGRREGRTPIFDAPDTRTPLGPGDWAHWAPGDLVAHQLLNDTDDDVLLLVIGTDRVDDDVVLYPERAVPGGVAAYELLAASFAQPTAAPPRQWASPFPADTAFGTLEPTDYFAGESRRATLAAP